MDNNDNMRDNSSKQILLSVLGVAILVVAVVGVSFAAFTYTGTGTKENKISTGTISMTYTEETNGISISNALPMTDTAGKALSGENEKFDFTVASTISGTATIQYEIAATKEASSTLPDNGVKLYLEKKTGGSYTSVFEPAAYTALTDATTLGTQAGSMVLYSGSHTTTTTDNFRLRMWMAETATVTGEAQSYTVKINVYGKAV